MITIFERYKEWKGYNVGYILMSPYDGIIIVSIPSSRMFSTIHFTLKNVGNDKFFNLTSYNFDEISRYFNRDDVVIMDIIGCIDRYPNVLNLVYLIMESEHKELIDVWKSYNDLEQYIEMNKYNL